MILRRGTLKTRDRRWRRLIRLLFGERGVTMVEFALVALPFFLLVFGTLELGFVFWGTYDLENATEDAARQIRTGQVQTTSGMGADDVKALICDRVSLLSDCLTKIQLDVRSFDNFTDMQTGGPQPLDGDQKLKTSFNWDPGGPREIVLVSAFYQWPLFTGITSAVFSNMADGDRLLRATSAFRNESWVE